MTNKKKILTNINIYQYNNQILNYCTKIFHLQQFFEITEQQISIRVYFDENYYYESRVNPINSLIDLRQQLEQEQLFIFQEKVDIVGIQNQHHIDIPINNQQIGEYISDGDKIYSLRSILSIQNNILLVQILKIPKQIQTEQPKKGGEEGRCQPYCQPLANYGVYDEICTECGEVKAFIPNTLDKYCTRFCYSSDIRKQKVSGLFFCSICISRYRNKKYYLNGCMHQCVMCHRPWLILNRQGLCRTCFATQHNEYYHDKAVFKAEKIKVSGQNSINVNTDPQIQEAKRIGELILQNHPENERIVDKVSYGKKDD